MPQLTDALQRGGLQAGVEFLNARVPHRFTGIYHLHDAVLHNVALIDKQGEMASEDLLAIPFENSFCQFVRRDGRFIMIDSTADSRVDGHVYQGILNSYVGVPLSVDGVNFYGTLCHFDTSGTDMPIDEFVFMERAVLALVPYLPAKA